MALLEVSELRVVIPTEDGDVHAVDGVSFALEAGKTLGIVGESGSGKSVTALTLMGLTRRSGARVSGEVRFEGRDLLSLKERDMRPLRGNEISMIFQDPLAALHPYYRVGWQIEEALYAHHPLPRSQVWSRRARSAVSLFAMFGAVPYIMLNPSLRVGRQIGQVIRDYRGGSDTQARARVVELFKLVGIPDPERRVDQFPHEFSGGMRQRVMIALALANEPKLLIADEPTTALDVTVQAQILALLTRLQDELGMAIIIITHDLGVVAEFADEIGVMYAGRYVERAPTKALFADPQHPYTWGLLSSIPRLDTPRDEPLVPIPGRPPSLIRPPSGCRFHPRCAHRFGPCPTQDPELLALSDVAGHEVACLLDSADRRTRWRRQREGTLPQEVELVPSDAGLASDAPADQEPRP
jgi:peptide/nickel transport system ATP-binding protein